MLKFYPALRPPAWLYQYAQATIFFASELVKPDWAGG